MRNQTGVLILGTLVLAALACRLPFLGQSGEIPEAPEGDVIEDSTPLTVQPTAQETDRPDPTETPTEEALPAVPQVFSDNGVEITLPGTFVLGDAEEDLALLVEGLQALSEGETQNIQALYEQNADDIMLWGYDTESPGEHTTSLLVLKNEEFAGMSLSLISVFANAMLGEEVESLDQERISLGGREVLRFLTTAENAGVDTAQAIYLFNEAGRFWVIGFFTNQAQIAQRLPVFDAAVASFTFLDVE